MVAASIVVPRLGAVASSAFETPFLRFEVLPGTGRYEILDKQANVVWKSNPYQPRFGEVPLNTGGNPRRIDLTRCEVQTAGGGLTAVFHPLAANPNAAVRVTVRPVADGKTLEFSYEADAALGVDSLRLLDDALWVADNEKGYAVVPVREGLLIPSDSGKAFSQRFDTFAYEGCHMEMLGVVKNGAAALITWHDPCVAADVRSAVTNASWLNGHQALSVSLDLRKSAKSFRIQFLGKGDYVDIAKAYRQIAKDKGWLVTWDQKLKGHPERAKYFGASDFKLWSTLARRMSEDSQREESVQVNWTFDEAAQIAAHLKNDLKLDKVLFMMGGWIRRGYDNQHPDILPAAPECGGDTAFSNCCRQIRDLGFLLSLHDNYQDIYRDSPSWNEDFIMKNAVGKLTTGGKWAGGRAYLTCSQKAVELARRPQNLPAVKKLSGADSYFIDTTYAAELLECFDPNHPLTRWDDLKWKQAISDYAREVFGSFGSECGREWAIPHADFFEGFTGVSGAYYHSKDLPGKLGAAVVPLFEMVYRDCIAAYGKYGYDIAQAADYVLHHISIGRPLNYHSVPSGLYWKQNSREQAPLALHPSVAGLKQTGPRQFSIRYRWSVEAVPGADWRVFVHFTDSAGDIKFQNDYTPGTKMSAWQPGEVSDGPFTVNVPEGLRGTFNVRMGLYQSPLGQRALFTGASADDRSCLAGELKVANGQIQFEPAKPSNISPAGDPGVFTRADNGWAEGLHSLDRFVKNTHEILSPLNELTAQTLMTEYQFLSPDRKVRRSVFSEGANAAVEVIVNGGPAPYQHKSKLGGEVVLPPNGFIVEAPAFAAFHARSWNGLLYDAPVMFTLRSLDGQPLNRSRRVRVFHAFGDARLKLPGNVVAVPAEKPTRP